jgi:hypothetical protein
MSKFVSARLGPDVVQYGHKGLYWFWQECPYIQWVLLLLMWPCTEVLIVGVTSFREREQIPGLFGGVCVFFSAWLVRSDLSGSSLDVAPASPFIVPKGRARVTVVVK